MPATPSRAAAPLTYVGPASLFVNGEYVSAIEPAESTGGLSFTVPNVPAGGNAQILYRTEVNGYAPLAGGSTITNTASTVGGATDSVTLTAENKADVRVLKAMSPDPVTAGGTLTYTFDIYNYGNAEATGLILTDSFDPAPTGITVTVDGENVPETGYNYVSGVLTLPSGTGSEITVPAATYTSAPVTGEVSVTPGHISVIVTGTVN